LCVWPLESQGHDSGHARSDGLRRSKQGRGRQRGKQRQKVALPVGVGEVRGGAVASQRKGVVRPCKKSGFAGMVIRRQLGDDAPVVVV